MRFLSCLIVVCLFGFPALAQEIVDVHDLPRQHAIAMHGQPKYGPDFEHLDYVNPRAPKGGVLKQGIIGTFNSLNPFLIVGEPATNLYSTYDPLMARVWDEPFTLYGLVAKEIHVPEDRSSITFFLDEAARFHDGHPVTAEDVVFSYDMQMKHGRPNTRQIFKLATDIIVHDPLTVTFKFGKGYDQETALIFGLMRIIPKHYWTSEDRDFSKTTLTPPLGGGPYKIKSLEQGRFIEYERVKDYWAASHPTNIGHHNFDTVRFDYYRDDSIAQQAFESGEFDLRREWEAHKWQRDYNFQAVKDGRVIAESFQHGRPDRARFMIFNTRRIPFHDRRVRWALMQAFDFDWLNQNLFDGAYDRTTSTFPNSELAHSGKPGEKELVLLEPYQEQLPREVLEEGTYTPPETDGSGKRGIRANLQKAVALLKSAGWAVEDGRMTNTETGRSLSFEILLGDPWHEKMVLPFIQNLKILGIDAKVRTVDSSQYIGRLQDFDYDMTVNHWINSLSPGTEQAVYWGSQAADMEGTKNYAGVKSDVVDHLIDAITLATSREDLVAAVHALDRVIMWNHYGIPLYYSGKDYIAYWSHLAHPEKAPLYGPVLETWWSADIHE